MVIPQSLARSGRRREARYDAEVNESALEIVGQNMVLLRYGTHP